MNNNPISINYSNEKLRALVEEYIVQQRKNFTFKGLCSYILYWPMEDGHTTGASLFESNQLSQADCDRVSSVLQKTVGEGILTAASNDSYCKTLN